LNGTTPELLAEFRHAFQSGGHAALDRLRLEKALARNTPSLPLAAMYRQVGDYERAIIHIQKAIEEPVPANNLVFLRSFPGWIPLRKDPRFTAVLREIGLDPGRLVATF
jgi:hypothetical protein